MEAVEWLWHRHFGKYRGTVTEVDAATFRIKAKVPCVLGTQATGWCRPCVPYAGDQVGIAFLPDTGAGVWIEFEGGDVSRPIWTGCYWHDGEQPPDATESVKAIVTKAGKVFFDGDGGAITIEDTNGNTITLDASSITIAHNHKKIVLTSTSVSINDGALEVT